MIDIYKEIVKLKADGEEVALVTVVSTRGSTPREEGAKMLVKADGSIFGTIGGGGLEGQVIKEAIKVISQGNPKRLPFSLTNTDVEKEGQICGGEMEVFIEPIVTAPTIYLFGGGHISLPLAKIGKLLGFNIVVLDDRAEFANPDRFPEAEITMADDFTKLFPKLKIDKSSYIVIVTRSHQYDNTILEWAVGTNARYIGMIGSKTKVKTLFSHLQSKGISKELLDKAHSPIGLAINAQTPEEIAVSILAEIVSVRRLP
ncbi:MAG: XdhC/CoxI family protein [Chloroflexota bacterium]